MIQLAAEKIALALQAAMQLFELTELADLALPVIAATARAVL